MQNAYIKKIFLFLFASSMVALPLFAYADHTQEHTIQQLQAQITALLQQITSLQNQLAGQSSTPPVSAVACPRLTYNFYLGLTDKDTEGQVSELQKFLARDSSIYPEASVTGYFGPLTEQAVKRFQAKQGIVSSGSPDTTGYGVVGPLTRARLLQGCSDLVLLPIVPPVQSFVRVASPNGGESWQMGSTQTIQWWTSLKPFSYVDIDLLIQAPPPPPCGELPCPVTMTSPPSFFAPIARKVPNTSSFSWVVGKVLSDSIVPTGTYVIRVSNSENSSVYDQSNNVFNILKEASGNLPPTISGVSGPSVLKVGEMGTWTVKASDPENGLLTYTVNWGDNEPIGGGVAGATQLLPPSQTTTFTHRYANAGAYSPVFTVTDTHGLSAKTSISVNVGSVQTQSGILSISPVNFSIAVGGRSQQVRAYYQQPNPLCPKGAQCMPTPPPQEVSAQWSSSNPAIADFAYAVPACSPPPPGVPSSCDDKTQVFVVGKSAGTATIKAIYTASNGAVLTATAQVTITNVSVPKVDISIPTQPSASLAPRGSVIPFTSFQITTQDANAYLKSVAVERTGLGSDGAFDQIGLVVNDSPNGPQVGRIVAYGKLDPVTHRAVLNPAANFNPLNAGTATRFSIVGIMNRDLAPYAGQVAYLSVTGMELTNDAGKSFELPAVFPIKGAGHTVNNSLTIGSLPITSITGTGGYTTGYTLSASPAEDLVLKEIFMGGDVRSVLINGVKYACTPIVSLSTCLLKEAVRIPKDGSVTLTGGTLSDVWVEGWIYGYRLSPLFSTSPQLPSIKVLFPNGGETLRQGELHELRWEPPTGVSYVTLGIQEQVPAGTGYENAYTVIAENVPNTGSYLWTAQVYPVPSGYTPAIDPKITPGSYKLRATAIVGGKVILDDSDAPFSIVGASSGICNTSYPQDKFHVCYYGNEITRLGKGAESVLHQEDEKLLSSPVGSETVFDHDWGNGLISLTGKSDAVQGVWRGRINFQPAQYIFHTLSDDGVVLNIDGYGDVISNWTRHGVTQDNSGVIGIPAGYRNVTLTWNDLGGYARAKLWWEIPLLSGLDAFIQFQNGLSVKVNGGVVGAVGPMTWNWGDGTEEMAYFPASHSYAIDGTYTITVTARNGGGAVSKKIAVDAYKNLTMSLFTPVVNVEKVSVNGVVQYIGGTISKITWNWGDGDPASEETQWFPGNHAYAKTGTYNIRVTGWTNDGKKIINTTTAAVSVVY